MMTGAIALCAMMKLRLSSLKTAMKPAVKMTGLRLRMSERRQSDHAVLVQ